MKRILRILLRFIALVALYMIIGWAFGLFENFNFRKMLLMGAVFSGVMLGFSESLRICLQSSYSRLCGGYRRLPSCQTYLARGQVPL